MSHIEKEADKYRVANVTPVSPDFRPLIRSLMEMRSITTGMLANMSGIDAVRIDELIGHAGDDEVIMTVGELDTLINALDVAPIEAVIRLETFDLIADRHRNRLDPIIRLLAAVFRDVSTTVMAAAPELDALDGTEFRIEWTPLLKDVVLQRIIKETATASARSRSWMLDDQDCKPDFSTDRRCA